MASLTVRQLDEALKQQLRLRAARNGRSVEDEVRTILRSAAAEVDAPPAPPPAAAETKGAARSARPEVRTKRVLLIVGGGIAAYKSLDLIRRLKERGLPVRCILTEAAQHFVTPLAAGALTGERVFTDLFDPKTEFDVGHIRLAREADLIVVAPATADLMAKLAGGLAVRSRHRRAAGDVSQGAAGARHEPAHVGEQGDAAQCRAACRRRLCLYRSQRRRDGGSRRTRARPHGRAFGNRGGCRETARRRSSAAAQRQARARDIRPNA